MFGASSRNQLGAFIEQQSQQIRGLLRCIFNLSLPPTGTPKSGFIGNLSLIFPHNNSCYYAI